MCKALALLLAACVAAGPVVGVAWAGESGTPDGPEATAVGTLFRLQIHQIIEEDPLDFGTAPDFYIQAYVDSELVIEAGPYIDQPGPVVDRSFSKQSSNLSIRISMYVFDEDSFDPLGDDLADISGYAGGGEADYDSIPPGAWFLGYYNLSTRSWDSGTDPVVRANGWWMTSGELDGSTTTNELDAAVLFEVSAGTPPTIEEVDPPSDVSMEAWSNQSFTVAVDDPDSVISYDWVYDGYVNQLNTSTVLLSPTGTDVGWHSLVVRVYEDGSSRVSATHSWWILVTPYNRPPEGRAGPDRTVAALENVEFDASNSFDPDGWNLTLLWDFGDGSVASGEIVYHLYLEPGTYVVGLAASDGNKTTIDEAIVTVVEHPVLNAASSPTTSLFGRETFDEPLAFNATLNSSKSWRINVYENEDYRLFLKLQLVFQYNVKHTGSASFSANTTLATGADLESNWTLENSTDSTVVEFRPEIRVTFSKETKSNLTVKTYIDLRFGFPSQTDLDGDGSGVYVGTTKIYLFDRFVEIYNSSGTNQLGVLQSVDRHFTLYRIDILELLQEIAPQGTFVWAVLDFLINLYLDFDLEVWAGFQPVVYLAEVDPDVDTTDYWPMGFDASTPWQSLSYQSLHDRDSRYFVLGQVLASTQTRGSLNLNVTLTWAGDLLADIWSTLTGWDGDRSWRYPLLQTESLYASTYAVSLQQGVAEAWYEAPPVVTGIALAGLSPDSAAVSWMASSGESVEGYGWRLDHQAPGKPVVGKGSTGATPSPRVTFAELAQGTGYRLSLWTINLAGEIGPEATYDFATPIVEPVVEVADVSVSTVTAEWTIPSQSAAIVYTLRVFDVETLDLVASQVVLHGGGGEATIEGLRGGHEYQLVLEASTEWASINSSALPFATTVPTAPDAPAAIGIAGTNAEGFTVNWTSSQSPYVAGYLVVVRDAVTDVEVARFTVQGRTADVQTVEGLDPDHEYRVLVYSIDEFNQQGEPVALDVRTGAQAPAGGLPGFDLAAIAASCMLAALVAGTQRRRPPG